MTKRWPIGCHISIRNGYLAAAKLAKQIGAGVFQYFPKNPRSLTVKDFDYTDANAAAAFCRQHQLLSVAHTPYPTNLAVDLSRDDVDRSLLNDLTIAEACGSIGVVVHFGHSSRQQNEDNLSAYINIVERLNRILTVWTGQAKLLIENQAGHHGPIGTTLTELVKIREMSEYPHKIGFCFDTCHAFASGMWPGKAGVLNNDNEENIGQNIRDKDPDEKEVSWEDEARQSEYLQHLEVVHLNDSQFPAYSKRDRHANIGKGTIGLDRFKALLTIPEMAQIPLILETPVGPDGGHRAEMEKVTRLLSP